MTSNISVKQCKNCNKTFLVNLNNKRQANKITCCKKCHLQYHAKLKSKEFRIDCVCQTCGKFYTIKKSEFEKGYGKHCSMECRKIDKVKLTCILCNKTFYKKACEIKREGEGRFCSQSCRQKFTCITKFRKNPSSIEQLLIDEFNKREIKYEYQYPFSSWVIDFAFPEHKIAIEADGIYWHNLKNIKDKDKRKDTDLIEKGWGIIHLSEPDIKKSPAQCVDNILFHIEVVSTLHKLVTCLCSIYTL